MIELKRSFASIPGGSDLTALAQVVAYKKEKGLSERDGGALQFLMENPELWEAFKSFTPTVSVNETPALHPVQRETLDEVLTIARDLIVESDKLEADTEAELQAIPRTPIPGNYSPG